EIALTPQMVNRFKSRFGDDVAVMHSMLSHGERYDEWRKIREGRARISIGARSNVFAPFDNVGRSEEHTSELQSRFDLVCRLLLVPRISASPLFPYTTLFRS